MDRNWDAVIRHAQVAQHDASFLDGEWIEIPLYYACQCSPPAAAMRALVNAYPRALILVQSKGASLSITTMETQSIHNGGAGGNCSVLVDLFDSFRLFYFVVTDNFVKNAYLTKRGRGQYIYLALAQFYLYVAILLCRDGDVPNGQFRQKCIQYPTKKGRGQYIFITCTVLS